MDKIARNSIGLDSYIDQVWGTTAQTYPPYNIVQHSNHESSLEIALAGFKKKEVKVYTEHGKLHVEGKKEERRKNPNTYIVVWHKDHLKDLGNCLKM